MSEDRSRFRRWHGLYIGVLLGIAGNLLVEALMGFIESYNVPIPPLVWIIEIIACGVTIAYLLSYAWRAL